MKAIILKEQGGVENLILAELDQPVIQRNEVLVKVKAISINPAETYIRKNKAIDWIFNGESPKILGWDIAGTVIGAGEEVTDFKVGDDVFGMVKHPGHGKAYAEYIAAPASDLAIKPDNISYIEAAAATLAALTAWQPLSKAGIKAGDRILITGAGGGVGHYAIQIAKYLGAYVVALASAGKKDFVIGLGADEHIDYQTQRVEDTDKVDLVLEALRDDHILRTLKIVKEGGKLISLWSMVDEGSAAKIQALAVGVNAYYNAVKSSGDDMKMIAGLLEKGIVKSHVSKVYSFEDIPLAHLEIEKNNVQGKIVISLIK